MSRPAAAALMGIAFVVTYAVVVVTLADLLLDHWVVQAVYFLIVGIAWVIPIRWLMLWSVHKR